MTYTDYFTISSIAVFSLGWVWWILYFFCVQPVYSIMQEEQPASIVVAFFCGLYWWILSIISMFTVVLFKVSGSPIEGLTFFSCIPLFGFVIFGVIKIIAMFFTGLYRLHYNIRVKRGHFDSRRDDEDD